MLQESYENGNSHNLHLNLFALHLYRYLLSQTNQVTSTCTMEPYRDNL